MLVDAVKESDLCLGVFLGDGIHVAGLHVVTKCHSENAKYVNDALPVPEVIFPEKKSDGIGKLVGHVILSVKKIIDGRCQFIEHIGLVLQHMTYRSTTLFLLTGCLHFHGVVASIGICHFIG